MNRITPEGVALVKQFEGFVDHEYLDPVGVKTAGYGHVVIPGECFDKLTEAQATDLLLDDLARYGTYVLNHIKVPLNENHFSALASLTFNMGTGPLIGTLGTKLNAGDYDGAAAEFDRWVYAKGRKLPGLVARRATERALFEKPLAEPD